MSAQHPQTGLPLCPLWKWRQGNKISCEGPVEATVIHWIWSTPREAGEQEMIFCRKHYERCEIYRCVMNNRYCDKDE